MADKVVIKMPVISFKVLIQAMRAFDALERATPTGTPQAFIKEPEWSLEINTEKVEIIINAIPEEGV